MTLAQLHALAASDWLIEPASHTVLVADAAMLLNAIAKGETFARIDGSSNAATKLPQLVPLGRGVFSLSVAGPMMRRPSDYHLEGGAAHTQHLEGLAREAARRQDVRAVLLDFDSPGGQVSGTAEFASAVHDLATVKPTVAFTDGLLASAAYWAASQAGTIVASPSSTVGSIGVYSALLDMKGLLDKFGVKVELFHNAAGDLKTAGFPGVSITEAQREHIQARMEDIFNEFSGAVTSMRPGVSIASMRGQTFDGKRALAAGLVDAVGSRADAIARLA